MVDGNCGYTFGDAVKIGRTLERVNASWFEEPFSADNLRAYQALRQKIDVPIAAGETWFTRYDFRDAFVLEAIDIAQPDVARCGGISETQRVADLASAFHVAFAPHTGQSSLVCLIAALHLAASHPNTLTYEFIAVDWSKGTPNPLRHSLGQPQLKTLRTGSTIQPPSGAGLGISIDWDGIKRHCL